MNILTLDIVLKLQNDIEILPFDSKSGNEVYLISVENRNYTVSKILYAIIKLVDGSRSVNDILVKISANGYSLSEEKILNIFSCYLIPNEIVVGDCETVSKKKYYFYLKYSLLSKASLHPITNILKYLFSRTYSIPIMIGLFIFFVHLVIFEKAALVSFTDIKGLDLILLYFIIYITIFFHELGHLSACHFYNVEYEEMGVGLYLYFLVFYSDVSKTWKLKRKQRIIVDLGGIYFQLIALFFLYIVFILSRSSIIVYAIHLTILSILFSLNPFFKFDGYWLISDIMGIENLRKHVYNYFKETIKKIFTGNKTSHNSTSQNLPKGIKYSFIVYVILSNSFFLLNIMYLVNIFSFRLNDVNIKLYTAIRGLSSNFYNANISGMLSDLNNIFPYLLMLFSFLIIFAANIKKTINAFKKYKVQTVTEVKRVL